MMERSDSFSDIDSGFVEGWEVPGVSAAAEEEAAAGASVDGINMFAALRMGSISIIASDIDGSLRIHLSKVRNSASRLYALCYIT